MNQNGNPNELKNYTQISKGLLHKRCIHLSDCTAEHNLNFVLTYTIEIVFQYFIHINARNWTLLSEQNTGTFIPFLGTCIAVLNDRMETYYLQSSLKSDELFPNKKNLIYIYNTYSSRSQLFLNFDVHLARQKPYGKNEQLFYEGCVCYVIALTDVDFQ